MGWYGYQGYRSFETQPPPALKPGETLASQMIKYRRLGHDVLARDPEEAATTTAAAMSSHIRASDYRVPDRRGVSIFFGNRVVEPKPTAAETTSRTAFGEPRSPCLVRFEKPEWLTRSLAPSEALHVRHLKSSYQIDMGASSLNPPSYLAKTAAANTTMDLCRGTTKATDHIPGYQGYLPATNEGANQGAIARPLHCDLRMYHRHDIPGYTGWQAVNAKNDKGPRTSGASLKTSSGAATIGEVL